MAENCVFSKISKNSAKQHRAICIENNRTGHYQSCETGRKCYFLFFRKNRTQNYCMFLLQNLYTKSTEFRLGKIRNVSRKYFRLNSSQYWQIIIRKGLNAANWKNHNTENKKYHRFTSQGRNNEKIRSQNYLYCTVLPFWGEKEICFFLFWKDDIHDG